METNLLPIAVFDSGVGGVSVLRELVKLMPHEFFLYYGDSAHAPYGPRPTDEVRSLTLNAFSGLEQLGGFKAIVVACNTATSAAIPALRQRYSAMPVIGIEPALKPAVDRFPGGTIAVMATNTTLREKKFAQLSRQYGAQCTIVNIPCPGLMEFVEQGELDSPQLEKFLRKELSFCLAAKPDAVVLGCTHYPFLRPVLSRIFGPDVPLLDGSEGTARETRRRLLQEGLLQTSGMGRVEFYNSLPESGVLTLCHRLLNLE